jgi:ubiquinone/menaquinone biosynthesis C-methylase UbiE
MSFKEIYYPESKLGGFTDIDGTIAFYMRINTLINPTSVVLDLGNGRGVYGEDPVSVRRELQIFKGRVHKIIGLDVDQAAEQNPFIDEFHLLESEKWPLDDNSVDLIVCNWVLEHVEKPDAFFSEARRVLKDGGYLGIRTANSWSYVVFFSKLTPNKYHSQVLSKVQDNRKGEDVFPTVYKCNTIRKIRMIMKKYGFEHIVYGYESEPQYLSFSRIAYWLGVIHQRLAPKYIRPAIFAFAQLHK